MANIVTHLGSNLNWIGYKNGQNQFTITFTQNGSAFDISTYAFVVNIRTIGGTTNKLQLTEGSGITNGGAAGTLVIALTQTQASTTLPRDLYFYEIAYTKDSKVYPLFQGNLVLSSETNPASTTTSVSASVSLAGTSLSAAVTLAGSSGSGSSSASDVSFSPAGNIAADNVQDAIEELDSEKAPASGSANYWKTSGTTDITGSSTVVEVGQNELTVQADDDGLLSRPGVTISSAVGVKIFSEIAGVESSRITLGPLISPGLTIGSDDENFEGAKYEADYSDAFSSLSIPHVGYVDAKVAAIVDSSPAALDTLNELAAALGDDANFATTVTNSIATKVPLARTIAGVDLQDNITASELATALGVTGTQDLYIGAPAMWPRTTNGCAALAKTEMATSIVNIQTLDFDQTTQEFAQFTIVLPRNWNRGTVTAKIYWTAAGGSATETVQWGISGGAYSNDDALTTALGTAQTVDDALIATNDVHVTDYTSAITLAGSPADADFLVFQISRNPGSDTLAADAKLLGVTITLTTDSGVAA